MSANATGAKIIAAPMQGTQAVSTNDDYLPVLIVLAVVAAIALAVIVFLVREVRRLRIQVMRMQEPSAIRRSRQHDDTATLGRPFAESATPRVGQPVGTPFTGPTTPQMGQPAVHTAVRMEPPGYPVKGAPEPQKASPVKTIGSWWRKMFPGAANSTSSRDLEQGCNAMSQGGDAVARGCLATNAETGSPVSAGDVSAPVPPHGQSTSRRRSRGAYRFRRRPLDAKRRGTRRC